MRQQSEFNAHAAMAEAAISRSKALVPVQVQRFLDMRGSPPSVVIVENPLRYGMPWWIRFPRNALSEDAPKFHNHEGAVAFCKYMGYAYTTEYHNAHRPWAAGGLPND